MDLADRLGCWIRSRRLKMELRQLDLAERLNVNVGSISRWERGEFLPNLEQFRLLCIALKASADQGLRLPTRRRAPLRVRAGADEPAPASAACATD